MRQRGIGIRRGFAKRRKTAALYKKPVSRTAGRAAVQRSAPAALCRDLGSIYPSCLVLRCKQRGIFEAAVLDGTAVASDKYYWRSFPIFPSTANGTTALMTAFAGGTAINLMPYGLSRIFGTSGTNGVYQRCCVLKARMFVRFTLRVDVAGVTLDPLGGNWLHFQHTRDGDGEALAAPTTQALADRAFAQPDVRTRQKSLNEGIAAYTAGTTHRTPRALIVSQRRVMWPHKELDQSFDNYVGQEVSFGDQGTRPSNFCVLELAGFGNSVNGSVTVENQGTLEMFVEYTLLLKDPYASIV